MQNLPIEAPAKLVCTFQAEQNEYENRSLG